MFNSFMFLAGIKIITIAGTKTIITSASHKFPPLLTQTDRDTKDGIALWLTRIKLNWKQ